MNTSRDQDLQIWATEGVPENVRLTAQEQEQLQRYQEMYKSLEQLPEPKIPANFAAETAKFVLKHSSSALFPWRNIVLMVSAVAAAVLLLILVGEFAPDSMMQPVRAATAMVTQSFADFLQTAGIEGERGTALFRATIALAFAGMLDRLLMRRIRPRILAR